MPLSMSEPTGRVSIRECSLCHQHVRHCEWTIIDKSGNQLDWIPDEHAGINGVPCVPLKKIKVD